MTSKRRKLERELFKPKPPSRPEGGRGRHRLDTPLEQLNYTDGADPDWVERKLRWDKKGHIRGPVDLAGIGYRKNAPDIPLVQVLRAIIDDALAHWAHAQLPNEPVYDINEMYDHAGLTEAQEEVVGMRLEGFSFRQIGVALGIHHSSVQERYRVAMAKLKHTPPLSVVGK